MVDVQWLIGGEAGYGIMTVGAIMGKIFTRLGLSVFDYTEYPSLIRGGHNAYYVRASDEEIFCQKQPVDILVALNRDTIDKHKHEGQESSRTRIIPGESKYLFVYPFVKSREWYLLPREKRQEMMDRHIAVGHKYATVKINTTYSFGLDDQEFVLGFETDSPQDFLDLVMALRETEASRFTVRDTPIFTCVREDIPKILEKLG